MAPRVLQVQPQANEQRFSQSLFLNDLTGIMIEDEACSVCHWDATDDGVMGGEGGRGEGVQQMRERFKSLALFFPQLHGGARQKGTN